MDTYRQENRYAYCQGDPINLADPSGHFPWQNALSMGAAVVAGAIVGFGVGAIVALALVGLGVNTATASIAAGILRGRNERGGA